MEHPEKIMHDAVAMYASRVAIALEERANRFRPVGVFVVMEAHHTKVVPDMRVKCWEDTQLLAHANVGHPSVAGALALMRGAVEDGVPFGVLFPDGGVMMTVLQVFDADRDRRA